VGGGGGGGQTETVYNVGDSAAATGGGGGTYAERFITDIVGLASSVPIVVGVKGEGGVGGATISYPFFRYGTNATNGGNSEFGTAANAYYVKGGGGYAGGRGDASQGFYGASGVGAIDGAGDFYISGYKSENSFSSGDALPSLFYIASASNGGDSVLGTGGSTSGGMVRLSSSGSITDTNNGGSGVGFGGGGAGGCGSTRLGNAFGASGGDGTAGVVFLELYA